MTAPTKSLGQIAYESSGMVPIVGAWAELRGPARADWNRIASAVALECARICTELAANHMRQAKDFERSGAADFRQQAAIECAEAIREALR